MEKTFPEFVRQLERCMEEGKRKYGSIFTDIQQDRCIQEKIQRFYSEGDKARNPEDIIKIAGYAYLWWWKEQLPPSRRPWIYAISSFSGWSAKQLLSLGIIDTWETKVVSGELNIHMELPKKRVNILLLLGCKFYVPWTFRALFDESYNLHPGTLPALKGKDPHERAIKEGYTETHATLHKLTDEIDWGIVVHQIPVQVHQDKTILIERLKTAGVLCVYEYFKERRGL